MQWGLGNVEQSDEPKLTALKARDLIVAISWGTPRRVVESQLRQMQEFLSQVEN